MGRFTPLLVTLWLAGCSSGPPRNITWTDLKVHCGVGGTATFKDKIRVEGTLEFVYGPSIRVHKMEKLP